MLSGGCLLAPGSQGRPGGAGNSTKPPLELLLLPAACECAHWGCGADSILPGHPL